MSSLSHPSSHILLKLLPLIAHIWRRGLWSNWTELMLHGDLWKHSKPDSLGSNCQHAFLSSFESTTLQHSSQSIWFSCWCADLATQNTISADASIFSRGATRSKLGWIMATIDYLQNMIPLNEAERTSKSLPRVTMKASVDVSYEFRGAWLSHIRRYSRTLVQFMVGVRRDRIRWCSNVVIHEEHGMVVLRVYLGMPQMSKLH
jgi:hypothetical protein